MHEDTSWQPLTVSTSSTISMQKLDGAVMAMLEAFASCFTSVAKLVNDTCSSALCDCFCFLCGLTIKEAAYVSWRSLAFCFESLNY